MARKNMFDGIAPDRSAAVATVVPEVFRSSGPVAAVRQDLRTLGSRSVQDIDPELIDVSGPQDRLASDDADLEVLRDSIARHGQQVPVLLRPHPAANGRYEIVYGRRRLAAIRSLGVPVKALIRSLSDEEAVLAQGQENALRKDPSFIEKALFAGELEAAGYEARIVQDALNVTRSHTSHMRKVRDAFPREIIERIGPAPGVGWKRWYELATRVGESGLDPRTIHAEPFPAGLTSDQRFEAWARALQAQLKAQTRPGAVAPAIEVATRDGAPLGVVAPRGDSLTIRPAKAQSAFANWLASSPAEALTLLHDAFLALERPENSPLSTPPPEEEQ